MTSLFRIASVLVPAALASASLICLLIVSLSCIKPHNANLYFYRVNFKNLTTTSDSLLGTTLDHIENGTATKLATALGHSDTLHDFYAIGLWGYCAGTITADNDYHATHCSKPVGGFWFDPIEVWDLNSTTSNSDDLFPSSLQKPISTYHKVSLWMEILYLLAICATALQLLIGALAFCSRLGTFFVWLIAGVSAVFTTAASITATALFATLTAAVNAELESFGVHGNIGRHVFALTWLAVVLAFLGCFFWLVSCCCCGGRDRGRDRAGLPNSTAYGYDPIAVPPAPGPHVAQAPQYPIQHVIMPAQPERPCQNCALSNQPCTYAVRDRKVTVCESYLRNLESGVRTPKTALPAPSARGGTFGGDATSSGLLMDGGSSIGKTVMSTLRHLQSPKSQSGDEADPEYEYFTLDLDTIHSSSSKDRTWLCKLLVVLALGESANPGPESDNGTTAEPNPPPGTDFFEQALRLHSICYENASISDIEVLNLIALYSNQLNRQKAAYMYTGLTVRLCILLQLHKVDISNHCTAVELERRKRTWWSAFCLDHMVSTQRGLLPSLRVEHTNLEYPSQMHLSADEVAQFSDPAYLTARIQLTIIQAGNLTHLGGEELDMENAIQSMLRRLQAWKAALPDDMALKVAKRDPQTMESLPCIGSLANLHLRYNQVSSPSRGVICSWLSSVSYYFCARSFEEGSRLGLMENVYLFISLVMIALAICVNARRPGLFPLRPEDAILYDSGKELVRYMMQSGSLAAKGHLKMLQEIESLGQSASVDHDRNLHHAEDYGDLEDWMARFTDGESLADVDGLGV
ncbi:SUR7/PalI family-domain-containing protein [Aspergillus multicolor]|uniref:SUR7/PalI family-domain-containing protein n=1 Tax=Aspergillus multicolor TaxID=41759 RepID=UPI003CCD8EF1